MFYHIRFFIVLTRVGFTPRVFIKRLVNAIRPFIPSIIDNDTKVRMTNTINSNKTKVAAGLLGAVMAGSPLAQNTTVTFNIAPQPASSAVIAFGEQADITILLDHSLRDIPTAGLQGAYPIEQAIKLLLKDIDISYNIGSDAIIIRPALANTKQDAEKQQHNKRRNKGSLFSAIAAAMASVFAPAVVSAQEDMAHSGDFSIEEIVVTAQKREQSLQDVAMSVTAIDSEEIARKSLVGMQDYLPKLPGISMLDWGGGQNIIVIRGMATAFQQQPTAGIYLGEVPLGDPTSQYGADMKLVDIERVEVLRGPQGTLYGSGTLSGAVRNIPVAPNLEEMEGKLVTGISSTDGAGGNNYRTEAAVNIPLIEQQLALRVVGYYFDNAGYVDMVGEPRINQAAIDFGATVDNSKDLGDSTYEGGRASLLWQATENLTVNLMVGGQTVKENDRVGTINPGLEGYVSSQLDGPDSSTKDTQNFANLTLEYDLEWATLLSSTSMSDRKFTSRWNRSRDLSTPWPLFITFTNDSERFVQELRLSSHLDGALQYVTGLFYEDYDLQIPSNTIWTGNDVSLIPGSFGTDPDNVRTLLDKREFEQQAVFGELYYQFTDEWQLTVGARWFDYDRQDSREFISGGLSTRPFDHDIGEQDSTYKVAISYTPDDDSLIYAQWSQGFRLGQGQSIPPSATCDVNNDGLLDGTNTPIDPGPVLSDSTDNIELGSKFTFINNRLTINSAIYRIDWKDLPVRIRSGTNTCGFGTSVSVNAGEARAQGLELEMSFYITPNLLFNLAGSYTETEFLDDGIAAKGEELLYTPNSNGNIGLEYDFELQGYPSFVRGDFSYVGDYKTDLPGNRELSGDYIKLNLRAGITVDRFAFEIFGNNLTNEDTITSNLNRYGFRMPPRELGISLQYNF